MPAVRTVETKSNIYKNLTGGLNVREAITDLADNEAALISNLSLYTAGALVRRGGWQKLIANTPTTSKLLGIYQATFNVSGALTRYLVITDGSKIWYTTDPSASTVTWNEITGVAVTLDATAPYRFIMMNNLMIGYNGAVVFQWAGVGNNIAAMPTGGNVLTIQDLKYTATGTNQSATTIAYTVGATAGSEVVTVVGQTITIQIQTGVSTGTQVKAAFNASVPATQLATVGTASGGNLANAQTAPVSASFLTNVTCPTSRAAIVWQNFLFWIGGSAGGTYYPNRLFFSNLGDPTTYPTANFVDIPTPNDGEQITGLSILYGNLIIFKRYSIYIMQGTPPTSLILSRLNASVGCVDPNSVVQVDNIVYFISDRGFYGMNLFNVMPLGYKTEPRYLVANPQSTTAVPIWAVNYKPRSQIFVSTNCTAIYNTVQGFNDRILVHDYFNFDANGNPTVTEYIAGYTHLGLESAKPKHATAPLLMEQYVATNLPLASPSVIASFSDSWVYVMTEGTLYAGGPADQISWMTSDTYPPTDFLSKFFDGGDPNSFKTVRWLWTTGQIYNQKNVQAGIVYNNSPTVISFANAASGVPTLQAPTGEYYNLSTNDYGVIATTVAASAPNGVAIIIATDQNGVNWQLGVITVAGKGVLTTTKTVATATPLIILGSPSGFSYQIAITGVGNKGVITMQEVLAPGLTNIQMGVRAAVPYIVGSQLTYPQGKFWQLYLTGIGILEQFSFTIIQKGRRG